MLSSASGASRWAAGVAFLLIVLLSIPVAVAMAAPDTIAAPQVVAQGVATPTPFRFLTPTPFTLPSTTTTTTTTMPRAGGIPMELVAPALAGGLAAIGGGTMLLRRRRS